MANLCFDDDCGETREYGDTLCRSHGGRSRCKSNDCTLPTAETSTYCIVHVSTVSFDDSRAFLSKPKALTKKDNDLSTKISDPPKAERVVNSRKLCLETDCNKYSQGNKRCIKHGGGHPCAFDGCLKKAQRFGVCTKHGGKAKCSISGCNKFDAGGGNCMRHGGGKYCGSTGCGNRAKTGGVCIQHGGGSKCKMASCRRVNRGGGYCKGHGGGFKCGVKSCNSWALYGGECQKHEAYDTQQIENESELETSPQIVRDRMENHSAPDDRIESETIRNEEPLNVRNVNQETKEADLDDLDLFNVDIPSGIPSEIAPSPLDTEFCTQFSTEPLSTGSIPSIEEGGVDETTIKAIMML